MTDTFSAVLTWKKLKGINFLVNQDSRKVSGTFWGENVCVLFHTYGFQNPKWCPYVWFLFLFWTLPLLLSALSFTTSSWWIFSSVHVLTPSLCHRGINAPWCFYSYVILFTQYSVNRIKVCLLVSVICKNVCILLWGRSASEFQNQRGFDCFFPAPGPQAGPDWSLCWRLVRHSSPRSLQPALLWNLCTVVI